MGAGVGEQVGDDLVQPAPGRRGPSTGSSGRSSCQTWSGPAACASLTASTTIRVTVDRLAVQRPAGVEPGEQQQVVDEAVIRVASDSTRPSAWATDGGTGSRSRRVSSGVPADRRQRGAQLVAGVGDELAHPHLALLPRRQGGVDVVEHPVEGRAHLADLGAGVGVGAGTRSARATSPLSSGRCDTRVAVAATRPQGPQGAADQPGGAGGDEDQRRSR